MLLNKRIGLLILLLTAKAVSVEAAAGECAQVQCDCDALTAQKWRNECLAQERRVAAECKDGGGKIQSYCGIHGPLAFPVATSLQSNESVLQPREGFKLLTKQIETQGWSLGETEKTFQTAVDRGQFGPAIQLASLLEKDFQKLFELQKQAAAALASEGKRAEAQALAAEYAAANAKNAAAHLALSAQYWQSMNSAVGAKEQRAYKILSFRIARTAASVYEFSADLYADAQNPKQAAHIWQQAASVAQNLIGWEALTENNPRHLTFYQAQASARWHRATFYWLQAEDSEQVARSSGYARSYLARDGAGSAQSEDELHRVDQEDMRAIKRQ